MKPSTRSSSPVQLDQNHAFAGTGEVVHLVGAAEKRARIRRRRDDDLVARHARDADDFDASDSAARKRRPARVLASTNGSKLNRRL